MTGAKPWVIALAHRYVRWQIRRRFDGLFVAGEDVARGALENGPVIVAANHASWWDALIILALDQRLSGNGRCLMDAANLERMPFFGWIGAIPLDRSSPRASLCDLRASAALLDRPGRSLWIFPQGRLRPPGLRPFEVQGGVSWLARKAGVPVVPLALAYHFREAPEPTIVAHYGAPLVPTSELSNEIARSWVLGLDETTAFAAGEATAPFVAAVPPRQRDAVPAAGRLLARLFTARNERSAECTTPS